MQADRLHDVTEQLAKCQVALQELADMVDRPNLRAQSLEMRLDERRDDRWSGGSWETEPGWDAHPLASESWR